MTEKEIFQFHSEQVGQGESLDLKKILLKYLRFWYVFVLGAAIAIGLAFLFLRYTTPQYSITSTILIKDNQNSSDLLSGSGSKVFSDLEIFKSTKNIDNEIEVLKSQTLMLTTLQDLNLQASYYIDNQFKDKEIYGANLPIKVVVSRLSPEAFEQKLAIQIKDESIFYLQDGEKLTAYRFGQEIRKPFADFKVERNRFSTDQAFQTNKNIVFTFNNLQKLAESYSKAIEIATASKDASVLTLSLTDAVPDKGKDILNKLIEHYNKVAIEDKNLIATNTLQFIDERLKYLTVELTDVEKNVEKFKSRNEVADVGAQAQLNLQDASENNKKIAEWSIQIDVLESIEDYLNKNGGKYNVVPSTLTIQDPTLQNLINNFNELQMERERLLRTTQPDNPLVRNINDQLAMLRVNILENLDNIKSSLIIARKNFQAKSGQFQSEVRKVPTIERELQDITRQQDIKRGLYLYLLQKREEAALALAATVSNLRVIDPATVGEAPVKPKKMMIYLIALVLGLGLPFALIYVKEALNDKVQQIQDIEKATNTPILGEISHSSTRDLIVVTQKNTTPVAEFFRLIRINLQFATVPKENKVILVTSSMSGEGKTFFSINLATSLVMTGKRVVILDFDLRKPGLMDSLGLFNDIGITDYITENNVSLEEIIRPSQIEQNLYVIGSGPIPNNPTELLMDRKVGQLIRELREAFDYIIIDTAPVGLVADALCLAPYNDSTLYLIRHNYTPLAQIKNINDIYKNKKFNHPMIVYNDIKVKNENVYGYKEKTSKTKVKKSVR
jgi:capsular exopolysaccharide synthesis family protein